MRIEFFNDLVTTPVDTKHDRVYKPWRVSVARLSALVVVPEGFKFDWDSVPRLPFVYWRFKGRMKHAACLHDWLYFNGRVGSEPITRKEADLVMLDCMKAEGVPAHQRWFLYQGVRLGGWRPWNRYRAMSQSQREEKAAK